MKKRDLKDYNRLLRDRNEVLEELLQLVSDSMDGDCYCKEIALIQEENTELGKDLNDLRADWAESNVVAGTAMLAMATEISRVTEERNRFRGIIRELKKEKYDMGMELEKLKMQNENLIEDLETARDRIKEMEESK